MYSGVVPTNAQTNVTQFHNHGSRDGLYVDPAFTQGAAATLTRDLNFDGSIVGNVYAQPLYIEGGSNGPIVIVVTESNNVYALDAIDGSVIWERNLGAPLLAGDLTCPTVVDPVGITGTPIVDVASRALFLNAMITPDGGPTKKHLIFSLNVDTGATNAGWPVDVGDTAVFNGMTFTAGIELQRGALGIVSNILYVGYGSLSDCSLWHGWLVGVPIDSPNPSLAVTAWATSAIGGGIWAVGGVATDGTNPFVTTGNTSNTSVWSGGEAVICFQPGPVFTGNTADFWAPLDWLSLDGSDTDIGSSGPLLVDVPGATPSGLVVALGKDGNAYLLNRDNLGGITAPVASAPESFSFIIQAAAAYRTNQSTYVALRAGDNKLRAFRITATSPPTIAVGWTVDRTNGRCGSPFVTSTDGTNNMIVWTVGTEGDQRLHGYDGDTGTVIYAGGGANELMAGTHSYSTTGIVARGRIYVAGDNKVYAFTLPGGTPTPTPTPTATPTPTLTPTPTPTPIPTSSPTGTPTGTPAATPTPTGAPSVTPTATVSPTPSATPRATPRPRPRHRHRPTPAPRP